MQEGNTITVRDRAASGKPFHEIALTFNANEVKLREIIAERIRMEIDQYERKVATSFANNLVRPTDAEACLDQTTGERPRRRINAEEQIATAFQAFERNGFFVLVGDGQVTNLDDPVSLTGNPEISFIKLTPLVGG
jgi:hypothetical protein